MQDKTPIEILTDKNIPDEEILESADEELDRADGDEGEVEGHREGNDGENSEKPYDPTRQLKNLTAISHESNDSLRRRRKRAKVNKIKGRTQKRKKRPDRDDVMLDFSNDFDTRSEAEEITGFIQVSEQGHAFIRQEKLSFVPNDSDVLIPRELVSRNGLRSGHNIKGLARMKRNRRHKVITSLISVQGELMENWKHPNHFQSLTSINPHEFYRLSAPQDVDKSMALLELLTPIGKGQRGLLVAPPRTGKTMLMEKTANGIAHNHPEAEIIVLLIDERPEEVTHLTRKVNGKVYASCLDKPIEEHIALCQMVIDIAQRKVERGKDVVILLDSITRMSRAYNNQLKSSGRTLSGGVDAKALQEPKKFFGSARKLEEGGSLTILATALIQTGSQMDEVIFQEFKGTGNMELVLNRRLAEKRIYPAIDIGMSGTRREELILPPEYYKAATKFRRYLANLTEANQMPAALQALEKYRSTHEFVLAFA